MCFLMEGNVHPELSLSKTTVLLFKGHNVGLLKVI